MVSISWCGRGGLCFAALTWLWRTRRRAAEAWARRRRDWRHWKSVLRIESPSSSGRSSWALRIRTLSEQYRAILKDGNFTDYRFPKQGILQDLTFHLPMADWNNGCVAYMPDANEINANQMTSAMCAVTLLSR